MNIKYKDLLAGQETLIGMRIKNPEILEKEFDETEISIAFGTTLKTLRNYKGLSLNELSKEVGIHNPTINRYENAINIPTIAHAMKLANYFKMSVELFTILGIAYKEDNIDIVEWYEKLIKAFEFAEKQFVVNRAKKQKSTNKLK